MAYKRDPFKLVRRGTHYLSYNRPFDIACRRKNPTNDIGRQTRARKSGQ